MQKPLTVCRQIGSQLLRVPDTDEVLYWVLFVRDEREGNAKTNQNPLAKQGCAPQALGRLLRPQVPSVGCSVCALAKLCLILRVIITVRREVSFAAPGGLDV